MDFNEPVTLRNQPHFEDTREGALRRSGRWRAFAVYGRRCKWCKRGILWIRNDRSNEGMRRTQVAIEPDSWDGEEWYWKGKHRWHGFKCEGMRKARTIDGQYKTRRNLEYVV
jgi:hypothetical protein